jgi:hypothetical protein
MLVENHGPWRNRCPAPFLQGFSANGVFLIVQIWLREIKGIDKANELYYYIYV